MAHATSGGERTGGADAASGAGVRRGRREVVGIGALAALATAAVAWLTRPQLALDDAAISFRYAERLATGEGFTYNDGQSIVGASSGLHTLLIAAGRWVGVATPTSALIVGVVGTALCGSLVAVLAHRLSGRLAAVIAVAMFAAGPARWYATGGLETSTLLASCLAALLARHAGRDRLAGVALGLAIVAKLDAATLAFAIVAASLLVRRRWPVDTMIVAGVVAAPWFLWLAAASGNPLPQSFRAKVAGRADAPGYEYDPTWALRRLRIWLPATAAVVAVVLVRREPNRSNEARVALAGWLILAIGAASLVPLGAPYPWYTAPASAPLAVLAGDAAVWARAAARGRDRRILAWGVAGLLAITGLFATRALIADMATRSSIGPAEQQAQDFRRAGEFIHAEYPGATVTSCFGWVAHAAPDSTIDDPCGITSNPGEQESTVRVTAALLEAETVPQGWCAAAVFDEAARSEPGALAVTVEVAC